MIYGKNRGNSWVPPAAQHPSQAKCEICGQPISRTEIFLIKNQEYTVCSSIDCKRIIRQKASTPPAIFKSYVKLICERRDKETAAKKHIEEIEAREAQENRHILQSVLNKDPELSQNYTYLLSIPLGLANVVPLTVERRNNYTEHLQSIISKATEYTNASEVSLDQHHVAHKKLLEVEQRFAENPLLHTISDKLCSMCKGGCCAAGKEHAYLSVFTMRRLMDTNPNLSAEDILNLYLSNISSETIKNACINQTKTGCALPRELRSDNCNGFYCEALKLYQQKMAGTIEINVLAVQRSNTLFNRFNDNQRNEIVKIALVSEEDLQLIDTPLKD